MSFFSYEQRICNNRRHSTFQIMPMMFTHPAVLLKGEALGGSKLQHLIILCFKCELSRKNSRRIFITSSWHKSLWPLDSSTNHSSLNTLELPSVLTTNVFTFSWKGAVSLVTIQPRICWCYCLRIKAPWSWLMSFHRE